MRAAEAYTKPHSPRWFVRSQHIRILLDLHSMKTKEGPHCHHNPLSWPAEHRGGAALWSYICQIDGGSTHGRAISLRLPRMDPSNFCARRSRQRHEAARQQIWDCWLGSGQYDGLKRPATARVREHGLCPRKTD